MQLFQTPRTYYAVYIRTLPFQTRDFGKVNVSNLRRQPQKSTMPSMYEATLTFFQYYTILLYCAITLPPYQTFPYVRLGIFQFTYSIICIIISVGDQCYIMFLAEPLTALLYHIRSLCPDYRTLMPSLDRTILCYHKFRSRIMCFWESEPKHSIVGDCHIISLVQSTWSYIFAQG